MCTVKFLALAGTQFPASLSIFGGHAHVYTAPEFSATRAKIHNVALPLSR